MCKELGIINKVEFLGDINSSEVSDIMHRADIFVHHSVISNLGDKEGIPTVIMEAMATGLPVISTIHSGIPELIQDGINGLLVEERNIQMYVKKLIEAVSTKKKYSVMARKTVEQNFNNKKENKKLINIYYSLLNEKQ